MEVLKNIIHWFTHSNSTPLGTIVVGAICYFAGKIRLEAMKIFKKVCTKLKDFNSKHIKRDKKLNLAQLYDVSVRLQKGQKVEKWEKRAFDREMEKVRKIDEEIKKREA